MNFSGELKKNSEYHDHSLEIIALTWAPDSTRIASCSLDARVIITDVKNKVKIKVKLNCYMRILIAEIKRLVLYGIHLINI